MGDQVLEDIDRLSDGQARDLHALYRNEWWTRDRTLKDTRTMLAHTDFLFGICDEGTGRLAAFARVLTDRVFKAFIFDVIVSPEHRGKGLGSRLMRRILAHPDLRSVNQFELACLPELTEFYERFGFTTEVGRLLLMRRQAPRE